MFYALHVSDRTKDMRAESHDALQAAIAARGGRVLSFFPERLNTLTYSDFPVHNEHKRPLEIPPLNVHLLLGR